MQATARTRAMNPVWTVMTKPSRDTAFERGDQSSAPGSKAAFFAIFVFSVAEFFCQREFLCLLCVGLSSVGLSAGVHRRAAVSELVG